MHLKLNRAGRRLLADFRKLPVKVTVGQAGARKPISTRTGTIHAKTPVKRP